MPAPRGKSREVISYAKVKTRLGPMFAAVTSRGVCRIALTTKSEEAFVEEVRKQTGVTPVHDPAKLAGVERELQEYFDGKRKVFSLKVDLSHITAFQSKVLHATARIPFGRVISYGELAAMIGRGKAARAVGGALGSNPVPLVVPCHRVVGSNGSLTGFGGGINMKKALLKGEGLDV
ncbi:MAG: methylated-DNA--[protein]-cysteine S-methyltransferase [Acidobacteria bacterium]|nr:methylated-DNA--[protein]-cysteine S-methyltransferase [Acidobacteriota bacterium]